MIGGLTVTLEGYGQGSKIHLQHLRRM